MKNGGNYLVRRPFSSVLIKQIFFDTIIPYALNQTSEHNEHSEFPDKLLIINYGCFNKEKINVRPYPFGNRGKLMMGRKDDIHWKVKFMNFKNYTEIPLPVYMKS